MQRSRKESPRSSPLTRPRSGTSFTRWAAKEGRSSKASAKQVAYIEKLHAMGCLGDKQAISTATWRCFTAWRQSTRCEDGFVMMRHFVASKAVLFGSIRTVELRQTDRRAFRARLFDGQIYDAFELLVACSRAKR